MMESKMSESNLRTELHMVLHDVAELLEASLPHLSNRLEGNLYLKDRAAVATARAALVLSQSNHWSRPEAEREFCISAEGGMMAGDQQAGEFCTGCHRPSIDCSRDPCAGVIEDRGEWGTMRPRKSTTIPAEGGMMAGDQQSREEVLRALRAAHWSLVPDGVDKKRCAEMTMLGVASKAYRKGYLGGKYAEVKVTLDIVWFGAFQVEIDYSELVAAEDFKELTAKVNHAAFRGLGELVRSNDEEMHRHADGGDEDIETSKPTGTTLQDACGLVVEDEG